MAQRISSLSIKKKRVLFTHLGLSVRSVVMIEINSSYVSHEKSLLGLVGVDSDDLHSSSISLYAFFSKI